MAKKVKKDEDEAADVERGMDLAHRARMEYLKSSVHGSGKSTLKQAGDKRTPGQKLYQIG